MYGNTANVCLTPLFELTRWTAKLRTAGLRDPVVFSRDVENINTVLRFQFRALNNS